MPVKYEVIGLGVTYAAKCVKCGAMTRTEDWAKKKETVLLRGPEGYAVAHVRCVGAVKNKVGGGPVYVGPAEIVI